MMPEYQMPLGLKESCGFLSMMDVTPFSDSKIRSCAHFIQIDTSTKNIKQNMEYNTPGIYYYYPALRIDNNSNMDAIFGYSSSTIFPSLAVTGHAVSDAVNTLKPALILVSGSATDTSGRYGDYFGAAVDPSSPTTIWVAREYHPVTSSNWSTSLAV